MLFAALAASSILVSFALTGTAQTGASGGEAPRLTASTAAPSSSMPGSSRLIPAIQTVGSERGIMKYRQIWGVDNLKLEPTASGGLIRFSYRVVDADKAQELNDKKKDPYLLVEKTGTKLALQSAERVGQLRQTATAENGRTYWMIFGNSSHLVKPGDRVDIAIGTFHAYGLFIEPLQAGVAARP
jgi:hypothetical protein